MDMEARESDEPSLRVVVIVPAFDEQDSITEAIAAVRGISDRLEVMGCQLAVYVVDDGSSDGTRQKALEAGADRIVRHRVNRGLGAAVRSGLAAARTDHADIVVKFDADLQHDATDIPRLIEPIIADEADLVYGNRFDRISYRMPVVRRVGNIVFTKLMAWLTGWPMKDSQPGIFAAHRSYVERFALPGDYNYTQQLLLDAYHKGMRFAHVPVAFHPRTSGTSFVSLTYPFKVLIQILLVIATLRPLKVFGPIGLTFVVVATVMFGWDITHYFLGNSRTPVQNPNAVLGFGLFGLQTLFFGLLGHMIIQQTRT